MSVIDDVKSRLDIVETVGTYVPNLKKSGRSWKANCPFHQERTPSFIVDPQRGTWHCFGACSTGGDVIEFVRRRENVEFPEALRICAERAGVELRPPTAREQQQREEHERLLAANESAAMFFQAALAGPDGSATRSYVESRGLDREALDRWQIGYAPAGWNALTDHLGARGFSEQELVSGGLSIAGDRGLYDRFRDRLMFPIRDVRGRLVGFGARALQPEQEPKYLNTPQTPLFDKSGTVYGLDRAGDAARNEDQLVIVEGYMDVIGCHQFGIGHVAASMGTAVTERQVKLMQRFTKNIVLALDADEAGSEAALHAVEVAAAAGDRELVPTINWRGLVSYQDVLAMDIRIAALPAGEDPDSLVRADPQRLRDLISDALPVADHLLKVVTEQLDLDDPRQRSRALEALAPTVGTMTDPVVRAHYVQRLARIGRIDERTVLAILSRSAKAQSAGSRRQSAAPGPAPVPSARDVRRAARLTATKPDGEAQLLQLLFQRPEGREAGLRISAETFEDSTNRLLFEAWLADPELAERLDDLDDELRARHAALAADVLPDFDEQHIDEMVGQIAWRLRLRRQQSRLAQEAVAVAEQVAAVRRDGATALPPPADTAPDSIAPDSIAPDDTAPDDTAPDEPLPADMTNVTEETTADEAATLAADFAGLHARQRAIAREYAAGRPTETYEEEADPLAADAGDARESTGPAVIAGMAAPTSSRGGDEQEGTDDAGL